MRVVIRSGPAARYTGVNPVASHEPHSRGDRSRFLATRSKTVNHDRDRSSSTRRSGRGYLPAALVALLLLAAPATGQNRPPDALTTARNMKQAGATATTVAKAIRVDFNTAALAATEILKTAGFNAVEITGALKDEFRIAGIDMYDALQRVGYPGSAIRDALDRNGVRVDLSCIDRQGYPAPCGNFGGSATKPAMGQLTWTPVEQGTVNGVLTITGTNIPQVEVRIGSNTLVVTSASSTTVVAALPGSPVSGALTLTRVSDGVIGELDPSYAVVVPATEPEATLDWAGFGLAAIHAAIEDARTWLSGARILASHCNVTGVAAVGTPGVFASAQSFGMRIRAALIAEGAPSDLATAWDKAFADAWHSWSTRVTIPGMPLFPSFAAWAGPAAPPTPALPIPLVTMVSTGLADMSPLILADRVADAIGSAATSAEAGAAIMVFATAIGYGFNVYVATAQVTLVNGSRPVPTYNPPASLTGAVTGGTCEGEAVLPGPPTFGSSIPLLPGGP